MSLDFVYYVRNGAFNLFGWPNKRPAQSICGWFVCVWLKWNQTKRKIVMLLWSMSSKIWWRFDSFIGLGQDTIWLIIVEKTDEKKPLEIESNGLLCHYALHMGPLNMARFRFIYLWIYFIGFHDTTTTNTHKPIIFGLVFFPLSKISFRFICNSVQSGSFTVAAAAVVTVAAIEMHNWMQSQPMDSFDGMRYGIFFC